MFKRLFDESTWHGKAMHGVVATPKVVVVLVFFAGVFGIIAADCAVRRLRGMPALARASRANAADPS